MGSLSVTERICDYMFKFDFQDQNQDGHHLDQIADETQ